MHTHIARLTKWILGGNWKVCDCLCVGLSIYIKYNVGDCQFLAVIETLFCPNCISIFIVNLSFDSIFFSPYTHTRLFHDFLYSICHFTVFAIQCRPCESNRNICAQRNASWGIKNMSVFSRVHHKYSFYIQYYLYWGSPPQSFIFATKFSNCIKSILKFTFSSGRPSFFWALI